MKSIGLFALVITVLVFGFLPIQTNAADGKANSANMSDFKLSDTERLFYDLSRIEERLYHISESSYKIAKRMINIRVLLIVLVVVAILQLLLIFKFVRKFDGNVPIGSAPPSDGTVPATSKPFEIPKTSKKTLIMLMVVPALLMMVAFVVLLLVQN